MFTETLSSVVLQWWTAKRDKINKILFSRELDCFPRIRVQIQAVRGGIRLKMHFRSFSYDGLVFGKISADLTTSGLIYDHLDRHVSRCQERPSSPSHREIK